MKFTVEYDYTQNFLPTKRHRNLRIRKMHGKVDVKVKELTETEFPVAFIVHELQDVYEGMKSYDDYENCKGEYKMFAEEIRTYKGELRTPVRITHGAAISTLFRDYTYILENIEYLLRNKSGLNKFDNYPYTDNADEFTEQSIIINDNKKEVEKYIKNHIKSYIYFDGKFWSVCNEPMYMVNTFGLGHNHGGTVMPEMVKANPKKEHGKGNSFLNDMEKVISGSPDVLTAGMLCMAITAMEMQE